MKKLRAMLFALIGLFAISGNGFAADGPGYLGALGVGSRAIGNDITAEGFSDDYLFTVNQLSSFASILSSVSVTGQGLASLNSKLYEDSGAGYVEKAANVGLNLGGDTWLSLLSYQPIFSSSPYQYKLNVYGNVSIGAANGSYGGNINVAAINVAAIPEPEIYAMLAAGLGLMGFVGRRRRKERITG